MFVNDPAALEARSTIIVFFRIISQQNESARGFAFHDSVFLLIFIVLPSEYGQVRDKNAGNKSHVKGQDGD